MNEGKPAYHYNFADFETSTMLGTEAAAGGRRWRSRRVHRRTARSKGGTVTLFVNGKPAGEGSRSGDVPPRRRAVRGRPRFDLAGRPAYQGKGTFPFTGRIDKITFELKWPSMAEPYKIVIGLEVHVQLLTRTKLFCGCRNQFGLPPNSADLPGLPRPARRRCRS